MSVATSLFSCSTVVLVCTCEGIDAEKGAAWTGQDVTGFSPAAVQQQRRATPLLDAAHVDDDLELA